MTQEKKSYESQIEQEKLAIQNIKNRKNKEVLNMFEYYLKKKNIIEDIEKRKQAQEEKENTGEMYYICFLCYINPIFVDLKGTQRTDDSSYLNYKKNLNKEKKNKN